MSYLFFCLITCKEEKREKRNNELLMVVKHGGGFADTPSIERVGECPPFGPGNSKD